MADWEILLQLVQEFHQFEDVNLSEQQRAAALKMLLENAEMGGIWLICCNSQIVGYIALCIGYSIEFAGKDAFVDEFYIRSDYRGKGLGKQVLNQIKLLAQAQGIQALHLEVARSNIKAQRLYAYANFEVREKYVLMSVKLSDDSAITT
ncbi:GNAT family N-acetyltransferase [Leptothoe sp. PORK10 BA2]|uniref:GNAT family N-acetyltransferase n=1 Tax=Leptothoe sp. PORK10 BA2 TaxID=3110254 RepID=UPI002B201591|nr:GNAT family N-acetyltransferase [Leptothoe sp. PORK10 BA2]MEA5466691.1 GNAT family N-acetyltransferase [Leptothoe sp. PORK10 BA2]